MLADSIAQDSLHQVYQNILTKISDSAQKSARQLDDIRLIAVSKTRTAEEVNALMQLGQRAFAENTIQDAMTKIPILPHHDIEWHFIGHLQSKKAKYIPGYFQWLHTLDSLKLANRLTSAFSRLQPGASLQCLVQVNLAEDPDKSGVTEKALYPLLESILAQPAGALKLRGLMTIGVHNNDDMTRQIFARLRQLLEGCQQRFGLSEFDQLSMGMSGDYLLAIEEGATMVRIGSALFGKRQ